MKLKTTLATAALGMAVVFGSTANADDLKKYAGVTMGEKTVKDDGLDFDILTVGVHFGAAFNPFFAVEGRISTGLSGDDKSTTIGGNDFSLDVNQGLSYGVYAKPMLPVTDDFTVYGLAGLSKSKLKLKVKDSVSGISASETDSLTTKVFGVGAAFYLQGGKSINVEYLNHTGSDLKDDGDKTKMNDINISLTIPFN